MRKSFSLIELMVAVAILVFALTAILASYANMFILADLARDITNANNAVRARIEEVKRADFTNLDSFNGTTFDLSGFDAAESEGRIEVRDVAGYTDYKEIRVVGCFMSRGRIIGEDTNFNGVLDLGQGEDADGDGVLDSPVEVITLVAK